MLNNQGFQQDQIGDFERPDLAGEKCQKKKIVKGVEA